MSQCPGRMLYPAVWRWNACTGRCRPQTAAPVTVVMATVMETWPLTCRRRTALMTSRRSRRAARHTAVRKHTNTFTAETNTTLYYTVYSFLHKCALYICGCSYSVLDTFWTELCLVLFALCLTTVEINTIKQCTCRFIRYRCEVLTLDSWSSYRWNSLSWTPETRGNRLDPKTQSVLVLESKLNCRAVL